MRTVAAVHSFTDLTWFRLLGSGSRVESLFVRLMTSGVPLMAMLSTNATAAEYSWKRCALLGRPSVSHSALYVKGDFSSCVRYLSCCGVEILICILFWMVVDCCLELVIERC
jgi:hypothetical protein